MGRGCASTIDDQHLKILVEQNPRQSVREISHVISVSISTISDHLERMSKLKKIDKWVPLNSVKVKEFDFFYVYLMLFLRNSNDSFLNRIYLGPKNGSFMTIVTDRHNDLTMTKHPNIFQNRNCMNRRLWWLSDVVHYNFLGSNQSISEEDSNHQLNEMHIPSRKIRLARTNRRGPILLHDNARQYVTRMSL